MSTKQNGITQRNTLVKILMDNGANASIIYKCYVNKNNFITGKFSVNQWSTMAGSFSASHEAKIKSRLPNLIL